MVSWTGWFWFWFSKQLALNVCELHLSTYSCGSAQLASSWVAGCAGERNLWLFLPGHVHKLMGRKQVARREMLEVLVLSCPLFPSLGCFLPLNNYFGVVWTGKSALRTSFGEKTAKSHGLRRTEKNRQMEDFASLTWQFPLVVITYSSLTNKIKILNTENRSTQGEKLLSFRWIQILTCASFFWKWK